MEQEEVQANDPSVEAAFAASFNDQPIESVAVAEVKEEPKEEVKEEPKTEVVQDCGVAGDRGHHCGQVRGRGY